MTPKYHTCGHRIWLAIGWNSLDLAPVFIDDDDTSPTCGLEIDLCPTCGDRLSPCSLVATPEPSESLTKPQILVLLRRLKEEIEGECGELAETQHLLLVDVCLALGFQPEDTYYVTGAGYGLVTCPLPVQTTMRLLLIQETPGDHPATHLSDA
jgi:hypothetical protein